jgi:Carboxypeptidase regulatory-like domain
MSPNQNSKILFSLCLGALCSAQLLAQMTVTGSVSGIVVDPTGKTVPAAKITLTSETTRAIREATSNESGAFSIVAVQPDAYSVKVAHSEFRTFERTGIGRHRQ